MRRLRSSQPGVLPEPLRAREMGDARPGARAWTSSPARACGRRYGRRSSTTTPPPFPAMCSASSRPSSIAAAPASPCARRLAARRTTRSSPRRSSSSSVSTTRAGRSRCRRISARSWKHPRPTSEMRRVMVNGVNLAVEVRGEGPADPLRARLSARPDHLGRSGGCARWLSPHRPRSARHGTQRCPRSRLLHRYLCR